MDKISEERIQLLHPMLRVDALSAFTQVEQAVCGRAICRIASTLRTFEEQAKLYAQGRTAPGNKVTNAKPGYSFHNYGLAFDIVLVIDGKTASWDVKKDWDGDKQADWMEVVVIMKKNGWKWGGDWVSFKDMPHFEKTGGYSCKDLLKIHNAGKVDKDGYVIIG